MKVTVIDAQSGKPRTMEKRFAKILVGLGRARYMTRDMRAQTAPAEGELIVEAQPAKKARKRAAKAASK